MSRSQFVKMIKRCWYSNIIGRARFANIKTRFFVFKWSFAHSDYTVVQFLNVHLSESGPQSPSRTLSSDYTILLSTSSLSVVLGLAFAGCPPSMFGAPSHSFILSWQQIHSAGLELEPSEFEANAWAIRARQAWDVLRRFKTLKHSISGLKSVHFFSILTY